LRASEETFSSAGTRYAATLYRSAWASGPTPVVVMGNGMTLTRRDGIPAYAERFTAAGFTVMAFDYRHRGDSGGEPRGTGVDQPPAPGLASRRGVRPGLARSRAPGELAVLVSPEAVPGFTGVTAGREWRNQVTSSWALPLAAFRPVRMVRRIRAQVLYQIADHDGLIVAHDIVKAAERTPRGRGQALPDGSFRLLHSPALSRRRRRRIHLPARSPPVRLAARQFCAIRGYLSTAAKDGLSFFEPS
jgi:hypothetical protein